MKKLLTFSIILCSLISKGQFKIGNISIDSATFKAYIYDCYIHPDTVKDVSTFDWTVCNGCYVDVKRQDEKERQAKEFNDNLRKNNVGMVTDTVYYAAGVDTIFESDLTFEKTKKAKSKVINTFPHDAGHYVNYNGFLMPRKPSEQDFVKWYSKQPLKQ